MPSECDHRVGGGERGGAGRLAGLQAEMDAQGAFFIVGGELSLNQNHQPEGANLRVRGLQ